MRDLQRLAGSCPSLGSPSDEWLHFTGVTLSPGLGLLVLGVMEEGPSPAGWDFPGVLGKEKKKKCIYIKKSPELAIQECVMFAHQAVLQKCGGKQANRKKEKFWDS